MKKNELKIGNIVKVGGLVSIVTEVKQCGVRVSYSTLLGERNSYVEYDRVEYIPFTEEWLPKMGFKKEPAWDDLTIYTLSVIDIEVNRFGLFFDQSHIEHIHQMQNLYFALRGQELKIN